MKPAEIFLSHSSKDQAFVGRLAAALGRHGLKVFYSKKSIRGAQQWHDEIGRALARCDWFLLVLSPAAVGSEWVKRELVCALQSKRYRKHIAPLLLKPCKIDKLSWTLSGFQSIDLQLGIEVGVRELLRLWGIDYRSPSVREMRRVSAVSGRQASVKRPRRSS